MRIYRVRNTGQVVALVKTEGDRKGKVLRSVGYTEQIPAAGDWSDPGPKNPIPEPLHAAGDLHPKVTFRACMGTGVP